LQQKLLTAKPGWRTALVDSIYLAMERMKQARNARKALVIVSDGQDNYSRYSTGEMMSHVKEADLQMYTVGIHDLRRTKKAIELQDERRGVGITRRGGEAHSRSKASGVELAKPRSKVTIRSPLSSANARK